ncbi:hypothetical protein PCANC_19694 [Puccinia coronata f. sp. avenae]|uniref:Uncharacterized protein n=1 Tax=Puccinia coronata f. sp. avenae TaxID=200324 RepID=A0A2N5SB05_9BASI|nr:hypothetical protein PCANC_19694 [Puccinia coronata f. sp. avenae]
MDLADIHHLQAPTEVSAKSEHPNGFHPCNLNQAKKISLAKRWYRFSLDLLISPEGSIYVKPTVFGIKAMAILGKVEHAHDPDPKVFKSNNSSLPERCNFRPENFDHVIFFRSLTCNLAMSAGLLREPLITNDEDIKNLDEFEIKSRRGIAWAILALECVIETQREIDEIESSIPQRLQGWISADGKSFESVVKSDATHTLLSASQTLLKPDKPEPSQRSPCGFGMLYQEFSHEVQHNQHESRHAANESVGIPTSFMPSTPGMIPIGTTSPMFGMGHARLSAVDQAFTTGHPSPPLVPSHPSQRSSFLAYSSSTTIHLSSSHPYSIRSQY